MNSPVVFFSKLLIRLGLRLPGTRLVSAQKLMSICHLLKPARLNCVVDVGANVGQFARNLRQIGYPAHIISFEPVPRCNEEVKTLCCRTVH